jgi:antitoxin component of MazEF toxin-antitoxin module
MKLGVLSTTAFFGASMLFGQGMGAQAPAPHETSQTIQVESPNMSQKIETTTAIGKVTGFKQGKSVTITSPNNMHKTFDLAKKNTTVLGNPNVQVGQTLMITETTQGGRRTIELQPYQRGVRTDTQSEAVIMQAVQQGASQVPSEVTREVKMETPGTTTETKTTTSVGKVTAYRQGNSLTITAPHNKTKKFDLSPDQATVSGAQNLQVGQYVKVVEVKQGDHKTIHIQPVAVRPRG